MYKKNLLYVFAVAAAILALQACKQARMIVYNAPKINTYKIFNADTVHPSGTPYHFYEATNTRALGKQIMVASHPLHPVSVTLDGYLEKSKTRSFLIIRNDTILYERYFKGYEADSKVTTFSVAKSFLSAMLGVAIDRGLVQGVKQPICDYFPELNRDKLGGVTIEHLLRHTSGIRFKGAGHQYYCNDISKQYNKRLRLRWQPGTRFKYDNANSQTLGILLERAFKKPLSKILEDEIWKPCGMELPVTWSKDNKGSGQIKAFCCLNGATRDFAKFGRLYLNKGNWNGKQIIPKEWVEQSTSPDTSLGGLRTEKYHWWMLPDSHGAYYAGGLYGQYIIVYPEKNLLIIRFAERNLQPEDEIKNFFREVIEQL
jgi:CubicO group peptidase (beta-lactamase class C family)